MTTKPAILTILATLIFGLGLALPAHAASQDAEPIYVSWAPSPSVDVVGYNVYRATAVDGPFARINTALVTDLAYADATGRAGETYYYAATAVDSQGRESELAEASNGVELTADELAPMVLTHAPVADQGMLTLDGLQMGRPVPAQSGVYARLWDDTGLDLDSVSVTVLVNGRLVEGETTLHPVVAQDTTDVFVRFAPAEALPFDALVSVGVNATDEAGNGMETYHFQFVVETLEQNAAADAAAPEAVRTVLDDDTQVLSIDAATATIPAAETQFVSFGAALEADVHLDQIQFYSQPVSLRVPLTERELQHAATLQVLRLNEDPTIGWELATVGDGWLNSLQVVDGGLVLSLNHSAAIQVLSN